MNIFIKMDEVKQKICQEYIEGVVDSAAKWVQDQYSRNNTHGFMATRPSWKKYKEEMKDFGVNWKQSPKIKHFIRCIDKIWYKKKGSYGQEHWDHISNMLEGDLCWNIAKKAKSAQQVCLE